MTAKKPLTLKIFFFLVFIDLLETFAQFCFKKSALPVSGLEIRAFGDALHFIAAIIPSSFLWLGLVCVLTILISWSTVLSKIDLSVAVPVCSFSYITIPLVSVLYFHEKISIVRWGGISCIIVGIVLVSISTKHKEAAR